VAAASWGGRRGERRGPCFRQIPGQLGEVGAVPRGQRRPGPLVELIIVEPSLSEGLLQALDDGVPVLVADPDRRLLVAARLDSHRPSPAKLRCIAS
jgi:hypothetical protein